jgi:hypothetical protein
VNSSPILVGAPFLDQALELVQVCSRQLVILQKLLKKPGRITPENTIEQMHQCRLFTGR